MTKAVVHVRLKPGVLDPEGKAIEHALAALGFDGIESVRRIKSFEVTLAETDRTRAESALDAMGRQLLANPVIEDYAIEIAG
jgi:phosphoribosylformylglycinamidine synthase